MLDRAKEEQDLARADLDIAAARARIERLKRMIEEIADRGDDTSLANNILATMQGTLKAFVEHRDNIKQTIEAIDKGLI